MKVFGIPVKVDFTFLLVGLILASSRINQPLFVVQWLFVVFISILVHELGHAFVCRAYGLSPQIRLHAMGGLTSWNNDIRVSPQKNIAISLAGPFAGFLFFGLIYLTWNILHLDSDFGRQIYRLLMYVNLFWGIVNLLPVLPLDGGHVVDSLEEMVTAKTGGLVAPTLSFIVAAGAALWAFRTDWLVMTILMGVFAWINLNALTQRYHSYRDRRLNDPLEQARESLRKQDGFMLVRQAQEILQSAGSDDVKCAAQQLLVQGLILKNNIEEAKKELMRLQAIHGPGATEQALLGIEQKEWPKILPLLEQAYRSAKTAGLAAIYAHALIDAHRFQEAMSLISDPLLAQYATGLYALLQSVAFEAGEFDLSAQAGTLASERGGAPHIAVNVACAHARAGRVDQALEWVKRALDAGYNELESLKNDPDLEALRNQPEFIKFTTKT
ncbi:MAG: site-2 protease family protein [Blastocatellia bacterium]|nr:site-2 protease family protein [Blastocatellia bacterium]